MSSFLKSIFESITGQQSEDKPCCSSKTEELATGKGLRQSPIDICTESVLDASMISKENNNIIEFQFAKTEGSGVLHNIGATIRMDFQPQASMESPPLTINNKTFKLAQFHFHAPSEHTISGKRTKMELHLVHQADDGTLAVIGFFFEEGEAANPFLDQFWDHLNDCPESAPIDINAVSMAAFAETVDAGFYFYDGSLTTPPYSEGVNWIVMKQILYASKEQIALYRKCFPADAAREIQQLCGRQVISM